MASGDKDATKNTTEPKMSQHDTDILNQIFNLQNQLPYGEVFNTKQPKGKVEDDPEEEETECVKTAKRLEAQGVTAAEKGNFTVALSLFTEAIKVAPSRASGYNNRAQALRMRGNVHDAMQDLEKAIGLSDGQSQVAAQAYTQKGLIKRMEGDDESALQAFQKAARLGNEFAKQMSIELNPYAAMSNQMMNDMVGRMKRDEMTG